MIPILSGNVASATAGGYEVANSCRFEDGDSAYMHITPGSAGSRRIFTFSAWVKRGNLTNGFWFGGGTDNQNYSQIGWSSNRINFYDKVANSVQINVTTTALFRDPSAWYHVVVAVDTTQGTDTNRVKFYINGTLYEGAFDSSTYPDQNDDLYFGQDEIMAVGALHYTAGTIDFLDGYLAEAVYIDGTQYAASDFGEFDEDSPTIWKPKDVSGLTFGTNGFYLDFEASDNLGNDANGGTDLTEVNLAATDQATDTPTNNFATLNPLGFTEGTLSEGNTEIDQNGSAGRFCAGTIQPSNGKWYFEAKVLNYGADPRHFVGVGRNEETYTGTASAGASSIGYSLETQTVFKADSSVLDLSSADSPATDDIYMIAYDIDNLKIYLGKNGTWLNSGDPAGGSGNVTTLVSGTDYAPITGALNASSNSARNNDWQFNFGNPTFAISSGNADANGYGNFEYSVPSGYYSLCSKNLAEFG